MARLFLTSLDLNKNEIRNAVLQPLASAPSSPAEGQMYYDTVDDTPYIYANGTWLDMGVQGGAGATDLGATLSATQTIITSSTGTDATIPAADTTNAGVMTKAMFDKLTGIETAADVTDATNVAAAGAIMDGDFTTDGIMARTASGVYASRTITGTANRITVTNGDGDAGNPTLDVGTDVYVSGGTDVAVTDGGTGRSTGTTAYALIATGTTATGAQQTLAAGATTEILVGGGASALPAWTTATGTGAPVRAGSPALTGSPTAPTQTAGDNSTKIATTAYTDGAIATAVTGLLDFKGSTDASANPNYPAASKGDTYVVSVAGKIGGASGVSVEVGDMYVATADNAGGTQASVGASWTVLEHNLAGALLSANNLSDVANAATAFGNIKQAASTTATGVVELATDAETIARTDTARAVTPSNLASFPSKYSATIGGSTSIAVTHNLGSKDVVSQVRRVSDDAVVECDIVNTSTSQTTFGFASAPSASSLRVVIIG